MGLLDRFKKDDEHGGAFAREVLARARNVTGVTDAAISSDGALQLTWGSAGMTETFLGTTRDEWNEAAGFDRIEIIDRLLAGLTAPLADLPGLGEPPGDETTPADDFFAAAVDAGPLEGRSGAEDTPEDDLVTDLRAGTAPEHLEPSSEVDATPDARPEARPDADLETRSALVDVAGETPRANTLLDGIQDRLQMVVRRHVDVSAGELSWDVGGALAAQIVLDHPNSFPLTTDELASWGLSPTEAATAAIRNLISVDPGLDQIAPDQRAWVVTQPEDCPAAWLCSPDQLLQRLGLSEAVLLAPVATELVVVDPADAAALERILRSTKAIVTTEPGLLWPAPLRVTMDRIEPWVPSSSHPCATLAAEMHALAQLL